MTQFFKNKNICLPNGTTFYRKRHSPPIRLFLLPKKKEKEDRFGPYFRVIFRTNCIKLASGIRSISLEEIPRMPASEPSEWLEKKEDRRIIVRGLGQLTKRERQTCNWLLQQPKPASAPDLANEFKITKRHAFRLISNSLNRLKGEKTL